MMVGRWMRGRAMVRAQRGTARTKRARGGVAARLVPAQQPRRPRAMPQGRHRGRHGARARWLQHALPPVVHLLPQRWRARARVRALCRAQQACQRARRTPQQPLPSLSAPRLPPHGRLKPRRLGGRPTTRPRAPRAPRLGGATQSWTLRRFGSRASCVEGSPRATASSSPAGMRCERAGARGVRRVCESTREEAAALRSNSTRTHYLSGSSPIQTRENREAREGPP